MDSEVLGNSIMLHLLLLKPIARYLFIGIVSAWFFFYMVLLIISYNYPINAPFNNASISKCIHENQGRIYTFSYDNDITINRAISFEINIILLYPSFCFVLKRSSPIWDRKEWIIDVIRTIRNGYGSNQY